MDLLHDVATYLFARLTGNDNPPRNATYQAICSAFASSANAVVEDQEYDFCLLLGFAMTVSMINNDPAANKPCFLYTRYAHQSRHALATSEIAHELGMLGVPVLRYDLRNYDTGHTLVISWPNQVYIAFQKVGQNRWAKRTFPASLKSHVGVLDFMEGYRMANNGTLPPIDSSVRTEIPLLWVAD